MRKSLFLWLKYNDTNKYKKQKVHCPHFRCFHSFSCCVVYVLYYLSLFSDLFTKNNAQNWCSPSLFLNTHCQYNSQQQNYRLKSIIRSKEISSLTKLVSFVTEQAHIQYFDAEQEWNIPTSARLFSFPSIPLVHPRSVSSINMILGHATLHRIMPQNNDNYALSKTNFIFNVIHFNGNFTTLHTSLMLTLLSLLLLLLLLCCSIAMISDMNSQPKHHKHTTVWSFLCYSSLLLTVCHHFV